MATIKKYNGSTWVDAPLRKMGTATDTITPPTTIYADGTAATLSIKGNMVQNGMPTPDSPIMPQGTGERTAQMFDGTYINGYIGTGGNQYTTVDTSANSAVIKINPNTTYTIKKYDTSNRFTIGTTSNYPVNGDIVDVLHTDATVQVATITTPSNAAYLIIYVSTSSEQATPKLMLNEGSQPLPYEPYGYKIPILNNSQTTNVYLGEVESTRKIKKVELTGNESGYSDWKKSVTYQGSFYAKVFSNMGMPKEVVCSHAEYTPTISASTYVYGKCGVDGSNPDRNLNLFIGEASWTVSDFKAYLQQQYANGTPVTIWYVLATPETAVANKPIRKIGDYADEVSGISIPTIAGANTLSVDTTLQPSEVSATYHGWHEGTVKDYENGDWQLPQAQALSLSNAPMLSMAIPDIDEPIPVIEPETTE